MAQYVRPDGCTRTLASLSLGSGAHMPMTIAVDTTDPVAGPQLLIGDLHDGLRCLHLRTHKSAMIAVVNGRTPSSAAPLNAVRSIVVAPNGALFIADAMTTVSRLSAATRSGSGAGAATARVLSVPVRRVGACSSLARMPNAFRRNRCTRRMS
jgi:hypothetical protein